MKDLRIKGVNGFGHWPFIERMKGQLDGNHGQIRPAEEGYSSPWVLRKASCCEKYINLGFLTAAKALEEPHRDVYIVIEELKQLKQEKYPEKQSDIPESTRRMKMRRLSKIESDSKQCLRLRIRLSEIEALIEEKDTELEHFIQRVESLLDEHVSSYWTGVLHVMGGETNLPLHPIVRLVYPEGRKIYSQKKNKIIELIHKTLADIQEV